MDWTRAVDNYCERLGPGLWAEPWNLVTNAAFLLAGLLMAQRCRGMVTGQVLAALLFIIGLGSALFHSLAMAWASLADVIPILAFILAYLYVSNRDFLGFPANQSAALTFLFLPYAWFTIPLFQRIPGIGSSAGYAPVPLLILLYAALMLARRPATAGRLLAGALMLLVSLTFRSLDMPLCPRWPLGTHFLWHLLNAVMLAWMIETWRRHMLEAGGAGR